MEKRGKNEGTIRKRKDGRWEARAIIGRTIDGKPKFKYIYKKTRAEVSAELSKVLAELADDSFINETIKKNICEFVKVPKVFRKEMRVLSREEQKNLITASRNHRLGIVVILDLFTGMRLGEILALRWNDIDFDKKIIYVKNTIKRVTTHNSNGNKTEIILDTPKTENSFRIIPLIDEMITELKTHKKIQNNQKQTSGSAYSDKNFLFCNEIGEPYDQKTFKNYYNKILAECGLLETRPKTIRDKIKKGLKTKPKPKGGTPNVTFHTLRHTFATRAIEQGMDILVLSKILGHSDPSTTLNKYGHALPNHKKDNMEKIRELYFV